MKSPHLHPQTRRTRPLQRTSPPPQKHSNPWKSPLQMSTSSRHNRAARTTRRAWRTAMRATILSAGQQVARRAARQEVRSWIRRAEGLRRVRRRRIGSSRCLNVITLRCSMKWDGMEFCLSFGAGTLLAGASKVSWSLLSRPSYAGSFVRQFYILAISRPSLC